MKAKRRHTRQPTYMVGWIEADMKPQELAYNTLKGACRHLISSLNTGTPPTAAQAHCFVLLWQAQCAIIHSCDIFDSTAIQANLATAGYAVSRDGSIIQLDLNALIRRHLDAS